MRPMNCRRVSIKLVDGSVVNGTVNIGRSRRLSDFFNKYDSTFLVLFEVTVDAQNYEVLFVSRQHILWAKPEDGGKVCSLGVDEDELKIAFDSAPKR
jgi:hypothetical protein